MKKILFATSAMVATGLFAGTAQAADPIQLKVGGYMKYYYAYASEPSNIKKKASYGLHTKQDNEVHFSGSTMLDNGIKVDAKIELEGTGGDNTDKVYVKFGGDFGQVTLGQNGNAGASMHVTPPSSGFIGYDDSGFGTYLNKPSMNGDSLPATYSAYAGGADRKITYMSPSLSGVTFGASYTPDSGIKQGNKKSDHKANAHNGVALGLAYGGNFSGMDVSVSLGYETIERKKDKVMKGEDGSAALWATGVSLGYDNLTFGAAYGVKEDVDNPKNELESFSVGVGYAMGDASVSVGYASGEYNQKATKAKDNTSTDVFDVGLAYNVGAGIKWESSVTFVSFDGDKKYKKTDANQNSGESWVVGTGLALSF